MKKWYIILIFAGVIGGFFGIRDVLKAHFLQKETITFNPVNYIFMPSEWQEIVKDTECLNNYRSSMEKLRVTRKTQKSIELFAESWTEHRAKVQAFKPTFEIVYVKRIAVSPDMIMMSPTTYHERYSGNIVDASGRGADKERLHLFYLSDGEIIKASARTNSEWLAVSEGQKVKKTRHMLLQSDGTYLLGFLPQNARLSFAFGRCHANMSYWKIPTMCEEIKTEYTPIFFN